MKRPLGRILQRLEAAALAAGTLWLVGVTAGSDTAKISSSSGWEVMGACMGSTRSSNHVKPLNSRLA